MRRGECGRKREEDKTDIKVTRTSSFRLQALSGPCRYPCGKVCKSQAQLVYQESDPRP